MRATDLVEVEGARWEELVHRLGVEDLYYSRGFVAASAGLVDGTPVLLHLAAPDGDVVFPCLLREDPRDVVTPYGYGGPLGVGPDPPLPAFAAAYAGWCARRSVITTFVVYHPLFANQRHAAQTGLRPAALAGTVAWPLAGPDLLEGMHKHHRRLVRRARAQGLVATVDRSPADLSAFVALYEDTMRRAGAARFYLFPTSYWDALLRDVALVRVDVRDAEGRLLAGVLGAGAPPWLHYHLGGATDAGRGTGASHLALYALACHGRENGYAALHLGGGVGGRADSLLEFKRRFAPGALLDAHVGKAVHDPAAYAELTGTERIDWQGFFPAYRALG